jgi:hypothetical protein
VRLVGVEVPHRGRHGHRGEQPGVGLGDHVERVGEGLLAGPGQLLAVVAEQVEQAGGAAHAVHGAVGEQPGVRLPVGG